MRKKFIPASVLFAEWHKDPEYMREYDALEEEFARAQMVIGARTHADLSQAELAQRMGTSQSAIAQLESGRVKPSTRTLENWQQQRGCGCGLCWNRLGWGIRVVSPYMPEFSPKLCLGAELRFGSRRNVEGGWRGRYST